MCGSGWWVECFVAHSLVDLFTAENSQIALEIMLQGRSMPNCSFVSANSFLFQWNTSFNLKLISSSPFHFEVFHVCSWATTLILFPLSSPFLICRAFDKDESSAIHFTFENFPGDTLSSQGGDELLSWAVNCCHPSIKACHHHMYKVVVILCPTSDRAAQKYIGIAGTVFCAGPPPVIPCTYYYFNLWNTGPH